MTNAPSRFWLVQHSSSNAPVAKFDTVGKTPIPDEIVDHNGFEIEGVDKREDLPDLIDQSSLSKYEKEILSQIYPVTF
jgi:hypothetical protein